MLKELCEAFGVSGCEFEVREVIENVAKPYADDIFTDNIGNLIVFKRAISPSNGKTIMLAAHMDEVGLIITQITDDGFLRFNTVGGIDATILPSKRVKINNISGIIGVKPIHLTPVPEREKPLKISDLYIDIGAKSYDDAKKHVTIGDYVGFESDFVEFGEQIKAKALDDRAGCAILLKTLKTNWNFDLFCVFTVQEETGLRGASVASNVVKSRVKDIDNIYALVVEATTCNDLPNVPEHSRVTKLGDGPAISILDSASFANRKLVEILKKVAIENEIPFQFKASTKGGNDAGAITIRQIPVASVSVPCRYIHSPVCVMNKHDFEHTQNLVSQFLRKMADEDMEE